MFDAHIQYYSYGNIEDDDYMIGLFGNKQFWIDIINRWKIQDGDKNKYTVENWDELECATDFRGIQLAAIEPDDKDYLIHWTDGDDENTMRITNKNVITWENNPQNKESIPRWITRLKHAMKENNI